MFKLFPKVRKANSNPINKIIFSSIDRLRVMNDKNSSKCCLYNINYMSIIYEKFSNKQLYELTTE
ncbi:hypothetical protein BLOT_009004 [Blomia tropicalis]|nr:hypothetical protein BLOT_009004 [Blomia tropicalis]